MRNQIKRLVAMIMMFTVLCGHAITANAAPKTMPDGTTFNAEYYAETYPDVKAAFGTDEAKLWKHYCEHGRDEGRKASANEVTPAEMLDLIKKAFPAGTAWGMNVTYDLAGYVKGNGLHKTGAGCMAYAYMVSDAFYGTAPATLSRGETEVYMYDAVFLDKDSHCGIVIGINPEAYTITLAEANVNGKVSYGRTVSANTISGVIKRY